VTSHWERISAIVSKLKEVVWVATVRDVTRCQLTVIMKLGSLNRAGALVTVIITPFSQRSSSLHKNAIYLEFDADLSSNGKSGSLNRLVISVLL
jgi:hypothetical protein